MIELMKLSPELIKKTCPEAEVFESVLSLDKQNILELGCGDAFTTRLIAMAGEGRSITAAEVDVIQHDKTYSLMIFPMLILSCQAAKKFLLMIIVLILYLCSNPFTMCRKILCSRHFMKLNGF